jgi:hypothetical protein
MGMTMTENIFTNQTEQRKFGNPENLEMLDYINVTPKK